MTIAQTLAVAIRHQKAGQLQQAETLYRQILSQQPDNPEALHYLGLIAHQAGQGDAAIELMRSVL